MLSFKDCLNLPSGRIYLWETEKGHLVESVDMCSISHKTNADKYITDPTKIWDLRKPLEEKWLINLSSQVGCSHNCKFCDVGVIPFIENLSHLDMITQLEGMLKCNPEYNLGGEKSFKKVKIALARMGDPSHNLTEVRKFYEILKINYPRIKWLPCFNSIFPYRTIEGNTGEQVLEEALEIKEGFFNGDMQVQVSCNSTDEGERSYLAGGVSLVPLKRIAEIVNRRKITKRTVTLNFIVMSGFEIDVEKLKKLELYPDKFLVKLVPVTETRNSRENMIRTSTSEPQIKLKFLKDHLEKEGIPVLIDTTTRYEQFGLCCGQLVQKFINK